MNDRSHRAGVCRPALMIRWASWTVKDTPLRHGITNAGLEAVNAVIQWVKKTARGFRNAEHFKIAIFFHCGGLDLYPHESR